MIIDLGKEIYPGLFLSIRFLVIPKNEEIRYNNMEINGRDIQ